MLPCYTPFRGFYFLPWKSASMEVNKIKNLEVCFTFTMEVNTLSIDTIYFSVEGKNYMEVPWGIELNFKTFPWKLYLLPSSTFPWKEANSEGKYCGRSDRHGIHTRLFEWSFPVRRNMLVLGLTHRKVGRVEESKTPLKFVVFLVRY